MFELALPWVLLALPLPWLIWYLVPRASLRLPAAMRVPFYQKLAVVIEGEKHHVSAVMTVTLLFAVWSLLLLALAGPRWVGEPQPIAHEGYNIMLALDISGSMEVPDMAFNGHRATRLSVVKRAAEQFVADRVGDRIGLILFGARAYLLTPLTYDHRSLLLRIADASVGLAGNTTSIGDALGLAIKRLENVPAKGRVIILLTDGVNNSGVLAPLKAAELARDDGIKVYTIGLGANVDPQSFNSMFFNMTNAAADLDEDTLKAVAQMTGGRYFRATDMQSLQTIYQYINKLETISQEQTVVRPQHDYYPWPLGLAWVLLLVWLVQRAKLVPLVQILFRREVAST